MGWRSDEVWLDSEMLWFREAPRRVAPSLAVILPSFAAYPPASAPVAPLAPSRPRLTAEERQRAARRRRLATRTVPAAALVVGSATMLSIAGLRHHGAGAPRALAEDPPSQTFRFSPAGMTRTDAAIQRAAARIGAAVAAADGPTELLRNPLVTTIPEPTIEWRRATSRGLWFGGSLADGTQLPIEGPDWITWHPGTDSVPNLPGRLHGNERTIRAIVSVLAAHRAAFPNAPRVVVGDISLEGGGPMDQHLSHQNGLDVDVYYPRLDRAPRAPTEASQVDRTLSQDLLDRFVAAGARTIFVGYQTGLRGPSGVMVPYPNHEDHMHVRFSPPPS